MRQNEYGLRLTRTDGDILAISAGAIFDSSEAHRIVVPAALTVDRTQDGGAGGVTDGYVSGAAPDNTLMHVWLGVGTSGHCAFLSTLKTGATVPNGYDTYVRRIGAWPVASGVFDTGYQTGTVRCREFRFIAYLWSFFLHSAALPLTYTLTNAIPRAGIANMSYTIVKLGAKVNSAGAASTVLYLSGDGGNETIESITIKGRDAYTNIELLMKPDSNDKLVYKGSAVTSTYMFIHCCGFIDDLDE